MIDIGDADMDGLLRFDGLIVGAPTWNTGSDEMRSMTDWDDKFDSIRELSLKGNQLRSSASEILADTAIISVMQ